MRRRLSVVAGFGIVWVLLIAGRLYDLQVLRYEHYAGKAERQQQRVVTLDPPRGTIYDAQGRELAVSIQVDSVYAVPPEIADPAATAAALARAVPDLDRGKLARQLAGDREFIWVARKLDPPVAGKVRALKLKGLYFVPESKRYYPMKELAAQVLGYVGTDNHGLAGLEQVYDQEITGKPGKRTVLRDARQGTVAAPGLSFSEPEPGHDLYLTLDATVQHIVERELARAIEERHARRGSAIFLDPATGGVLAMASYPSFDPNDFAGYSPESWRNRAVTDVYEPGSTFKLVTAAAALEAGVVREDERIDCGMGVITLYKDIRVHDHKPFGMLTFAEVIAHSSNVGVIRMAQRIRDDRFYATLRGFGFGRQTGIDLPGESGGILHNVEKWGLLEKDYIAFGQGVSVTPLQLVSATAAVANGGVLLKPHVVAAVSRGEVRLPKYPAPPVVGRPISPATARDLTRYLEGVVTGGTGKPAAIPGYQVAGKTGTAQIPVRGGYHGYLPSFVGFAPADRPALVGLVAIAEPQGNEYYGAQVAAPAFGSIVRQVLLYRGVHPQRERPSVWMGQTVLAGLPAKALAAPVRPAVEADALADGDDRDPVASPAPAAEGGGFHAPF
ncbi:MAG: penicillin-binding protein [Acidobacteria bacterium]|nr:MAG: penicillin-binding protein [Acidobacteriota bacterium]